MRQPGGKEESVSKDGALVVCHAGRMQWPRWPGSDSPKVGCYANIDCPRLGDADTSCVLDFDSHFGKEDKGNMLGKHGDEQRCRRVNCSP